MRIDPKSLTIPVRIDDSAQKRELPPNRNQESSPRTTRIRNPGTSQRRHTTGISRIEGRHRDPHHRLRRSSKSRAQNPSQTPQFAAIMQDPPAEFGEEIRHMHARARATKKKNARERQRQHPNKRQTPGSAAGWPHLLDVPLREVVDLLPERRDAGDRPRAGLPQLHEQRVLLPATATAAACCCLRTCTRSEQSFRHKPTQPALTPSPKHPHQLHEHTRTHSPPHPPPPTTAAIGSHMHFPDPNLPAAGRNPSRIPPSPERSVPVCGRLGWRLEREGEEGGRRRGERGGFK